MHSGLSSVQDFYPPIINTINKFYKIQQYACCPLILPEKQYPLAGITSIPKALFLIFFNDEWGTIWSTLVTIFYYFGLRPIKQENDLLKINFYNKDIYIYIYKIMWSNHLTRTHNNCIWVELETLLNCELKILYQDFMYLKNWKFDEHFILFIIKKKKKRRFWMWWC